MMKWQSMILPKFISPIPGETAVAETHPSHWNYFGTIVVGIILIPLFGVGLVFLIWEYICVRTTCYVATNARVISKTGWLNTQQTEVRIEDIRGVNVNRTFIQRILGIGDVAIGTSATEGTEIVMRGVVAPEDFIRLVNEQRR